MVSDALKHAVTRRAAPEGGAVAARLSHVGVGVTDLERSERFYREVFGFERAFALHVEGEPSTSLLRLGPPLVLDVAYLRLGGFVLELLHFAEPTATGSNERVMNELGLTHLSFIVDDVAATLDAVSRHGGAVVRGTEIATAVMITDPDGQTIELVAAHAPFVTLRASALEA
jgi:catechol 2,3-dioxygenase-like lactoylglutathione lyase family enzyme